ncbi:MAG: hypothetical protein H7Z16_09850 [Pyrinomonadaceae bacterium]|nr:hypothetical protein [Pyrinomonadaceae bacterium]
MTRFRLLGFLPLAFFLAQATHYWHIDEFGHTLWMCNIGNLLLAVGLFLEKPILIRVAAIWMVPGVAVWFIYVVPTWGILLAGQASLRQLFGVLSSTLAHLGGFTVGMLVLRRVRMDGRAWVYAFAWYFVMQLLSRLITPVPMNINVSQNIQGGWEQSFSAYWKFWLVLTLIVGALIWVLASILKLVWPVESHPRAASSEPF